MLRLDATRCRQQQTEHRKHVAVRYRRSVGLSISAVPPSLFIGIVLIGLWFSTAAAQESSQDLSVQRSANQLKQLQLKVARLVVRQFPANFYAHRVLANVHKTQGDQEKLRAALTKCAELAPGRADIQEQLGIQSQEFDDYQSAAKYFREALSIEPRDRLKIRLAEVLLELGEGQEAESLLKSLKPDAEGKVPYLLGEIAFQRGNLAVAQKLYLQAIELQPNQMNALYGMVKVSTQLNEVAKAEKYSSEFERVQAVVAELNQKRRREYDDITLLKQKAATTFVEAGLVYQREKQNANAIKLWREAASLDKSHQACRLALANFYVLEKKLDQAIPYLQELIRLDANAPLYYEQLGIALASSGDLAGAEETFLAMTKIRKPARGYRMLAKFYLNTNRQLTKALEIAKRSVEVEPNADSHFVHGWALAKNNQFSAARKALERAIALDKSNKTYQQLYESLPPGE